MLRVPLGTWVALLNLLPAAKDMSVSVIFLREFTLTQLAFEWLDLIVNFEAMLVKIGLLRESLPASGHIANEWSLFGVRAHMIKEFGRIRYKSVAATFKLTLKQPE